MHNLKIQTPRWSLPLLKKARYKGSKGGRSSGKSHFFAEYIVEAMILDPDISVVCIREVQKSLEFSAKKLIENKIRAFGLESNFYITRNFIQSKRGRGVIIFQGLQDHTAQSITSLESFDIAWCEEAQSLSAKSLELLLPTIRKEGSELLFSWNPSQPDDPVSKLFSNADTEDDMVLVHSTYLDNPFCTSEAIKEAERHKRNDSETYAHIWLGEYECRSESQVLSGKYEIGIMNPSSNPLFGLDFGFAQDPLALVKCYLEGDMLYIEKECGKVGLEIDHTIGYFKQRMPESLESVVRADCSRPEFISYLKRNGMSRVLPSKKGAGSVEKGVNFLRLLSKIVVHPDCTEVLREMHLYSYKTDKRTGDVTKTLVDKHNHYIDAIRYAIEPLTNAARGLSLSW